MRKPHFLLIVAVAVALVTSTGAVMAWLSARNVSANGAVFDVDPNHRGLGALATWLRDAGEPGQAGDPKQFGLYLQKHTLTSNFASAQAEITGIVPMPAADLLVLAFDISGRVGSGFTSGNTFPGLNGYCGAGAPRFVLTTSVGASVVTHNLGCVHGVKTQDTTTGWWEIKFEAPFSNEAYPGFGAAFVAGEIITRIRIIFDEGTDQGPGEVVIDNIRVNDGVVGRPTD